MKLTLPAPQRTVPRFAGDPHNIAARRAAVQESIAERAAVKAAQQEKPPVQIAIAHQPVSLEETKTSSDLFVSDVPRRFDPVFYGVIAITVVAALGWILLTYATG